MTDPERIEEALAWADQHRNAEFHGSVLATALREAQAEATKWRRQAGREGVRANEAEAENERLREYVENLGGWVATADEARDPVAGRGSHAPLSDDELGSRLYTSESALRDVDGLLADPTGHPLDAINLARKRISAALAPADEAKP